jgi:hypothetical protein
VALELFDAASTLAEQWPRLVEGAASAYADHRRAVAAGDRRWMPTRSPRNGGRSSERSSPGSAGLVTVCRL